MEPIKVEPTMTLPIVVELMAACDCPYLSGGIVGRENDVYCEDILGYNRAIIKLPYIINFGFNTRDLKNALSYISHTHIPFRIRSKRHDYEGESNVDNGVVIDLSYLRYVKIDPEHKTVKVGGGADIDTVCEKLSQYGYMLPTGICGDVGIVGQTSCGGIGPGSRYLGLLCDYLIEVELIDAKGDIIIANAYENRDLFWAIKGGLAANFGIVIAMTYHIIEIPCVSTYEIKVDWNDAEKIIRYWEEEIWSEGASLGGEVILFKKDAHNPKVILRGIYFGMKEKLYHIINLLVKDIPYVEVKVQQVWYTEAIKNMEGLCKTPHKFKGTSVFVEECIGYNIIQIIQHALLCAPKEGQQMIKIAALGGNIMRNATYSAYSHRQASYLIEIDACWGDKRAEMSNTKWVNYLRSCLDIYVVGAYRGFTDFNLTCWYQAYYGDNYPYLKDVKEKYDPTNVFKFQQSIR